jgi:phosphoribosyl-AMP cyclohydrolase
MRLYRLVKELGAQSVLGRPLTPHEAIEMQLANRIEQAYWSRRNASNEATWAQGDPSGFQLLIWAERLANG